MTSLMFLILLGIATCNTICVKTKGDATVCPQSDKTVTVITNLAKEITTAGTIIYTDAALDDTAALTDVHIARISEINAIGTGPLAVTVTLGQTTKPTSESLTLSGITLTVAVDTTVGKRLNADELLTIKLLTLKSGSTITVSTADTVTVVDLVCDSIADSTAPIAFTTNNFKLTVDDISKIAVGTGDNLATITTTTDLSIPKALKKVEITGVVTKTETLTMAGDFSTAADFAPAKFLVTLVYGNKGKSVITLESDSSTALVASTAPIVIVNTYSKFAAGTTDPQKTTFTLNADFALDATENRVNVPKSDAYCLIKQSETNDCPDDSVVLWGTNEISKMNKDGLITLYATGYTTDSLVLKLSDFKDRKIMFSSTKPAYTKQNIQFDVEKKDETTTGEIQFDNIKITASYPKDTEGTGKITFNKLLVRKSEFASEVKTTSMKLKALEITAEAKDLTSDISSFNKIKFPKPTKFTLIDVTKAEFTGDGKSVKINSDSDTLTAENIPVPFTIATLPGQTSTTPAEFSIAENEGKPGTALGFSFDVAAGSDLSVKYDGDWSANKIIVNVASKDSKFEGIKGTDAKSPNMEASGEGKAQLDGKDIPKPEPPAGTPTPKGGLSGGAIAGIVIACVVVVAAVVVVVVVVIKKKKGKVAN